MKYIIAIIGLAALLATGYQAKAGSAAAGQVQQVIGSGTSSNLNFMPAATSTSNNLPGIDTNSSLYSAGYSNAPVFSAVGARQICLAGSVNLTATNPFILSFALYCSADNATWTTPSSVGLSAPNVWNITNINTSYATATFAFGTNFDTGAYPLWAIQSQSANGSTTGFTNLQLKAYTKSGGL